MEINNLEEMLERQIKLNQLASNALDVMLENEKADAAYIADLEQESKNQEKEIFKLRDELEASYAVIENLQNDMAAIDSTVMVRRFPDGRISNLIVPLPDFNVSKVPLISGYLKDRVVA